MAVAAGANPLSPDWVRNELRYTKAGLRGQPKVLDLTREVHHDGANCSKVGLSECAARVAPLVAARGDADTSVFEAMEEASAASAAAVATMIEYRQAAASMQWALAEGSGFLLPGVRENGEKGNLASTPAQMAANLQVHLRAASTEDKRYTLHSFRVGGVASHDMDGTAMDVLVEYVGWKSAAVTGRHVGVTASAAESRGAKRSRDTRS